MWSNVPPRGRNRAAGCSLTRLVTSSRVTSSSPGPSIPRASTNLERRRRAPSLTWVTALDEVRNGDTPAFPWQSTSVPTREGASSVVTSRSNDAHEWRPRATKPPMIMPFFRTSKGRREQHGVTWRNDTWKNYLVFYLVHSASLQVGRILHGARDLASIFMEEES